MAGGDVVSGSCAICLESPGTVAAILDEREVLVCRHCFAYETGEIDVDDDQVDEAGTS